MNPPIVRVIIESMRAEIAHAMHVHTEELNEIIAKELKRAIDGFDFEGEMKREVNTQVASMCQDVVRDTMQAIRYDMRFKEQVRNAVLEVINKPNDAT